MTSRAELERLLADGTGNPWPMRIVWLALAGVLAYAAVALGLLGPQFVNGLPKLAGAIGMMFPPRGIEHMPEFLWALAETIAMGLLGTVLGAVVAFPLSLLCASTTLPIRGLQFGFRRFADSLRSLDHLIWAIVFVRAVGLGPLAGVLAIAIVDVGNLSKLYSEAIDNAAKGPPEGVRAAGGQGAETFRWGILPQVLPNIASTTLYMWESNTRSATILGIVGAGGIGYQLSDRLRVYEWGQASLIILLILVAVYAIDLISGRLRRMLIEGR
ncbi:phosphonate ABC transporter, permease protein PhnE [Elioraea sp.]|uniref:phosphonate ABC transporter, permease protein PhnE n=1 Tax=Elioraea sp. TaxID=2185103 RepID=UPI0025BBF667|nr:phosphonate ABC transporter, permease protein PhnE [Elioraea sp.]